MYSGVDKGSYHQMAMDIKSVLPKDIVTVDTIKDKVPIVDGDGETIGERDTTMIETSKVPFLNVKTSGGSIDNYRK